MLDFYSCNFVDFFNIMLYIIITKLSSKIGRKMRNKNVALVKPKYEQFYGVGRGPNKRGVVAWIRGSSLASVW